MKAFVASFLSNLFTVLKLIVMQLATLSFLTPIDILDFRHSCLLSSLEVDYYNLTITGAFLEEDIEIAVNKFEAMIKENSKQYNNT